MDREVEVQLGQMSKRQLEGFLRFTYRARADLEAQIQDADISPDDRNLAERRRAGMIGLSLKVGPILNNKRINEFFERED